MKTEFLKGLGLDRESIGQIMAENGRDVEALKARIAQQDTALQTLQGGLTATEGDELRRQLEEEKSGRAADRRDFALKNLLGENGCTDSEYLIYKLGGRAEFDEAGGLKNAEEFLSRAQKQYSALFDRETPVQLSGLKPTEGAGKPPETTDPRTMTYEQLCAHLTKTSA